jgi:hypothetical protein
MKMNFLKTFAVLASLCVLSGCGGGGGSSGTNAFAPAASSPALSASGVPLVAAADLVVQLSKTTLDNTGVDSVLFTVTAVDANRVAIPDAAVSFNANSQATFTATGSSTGSNGKVSATLEVGASRANRLITVTVTSGSIVKTSTVQVIGSTLTGTLVPNIVAPGASGKVTYRLVDKLNSSMANEAVTIIAPGLTPPSATGTTGLNGDYEFNYTVPSTATGSVTISATAGGANSSHLLQIQGGSTTVDPASINGTSVTTAQVISRSVSANPSVVAVNQTGSTSSQSEIRALFVGASNAPIKNMRVRFDLSTDPNSIGGTFSSGSTTLYSDVNGEVKVAYIPGVRSSPTNGVIIRACYTVDDSSPSDLTNCVNNVTTNLTVAGAALAVSIGFDGTIVDNGLSYIKKYRISVADSAGNALSGVDLAASVDLPQYRKGEYFPGGGWVKAPPEVVCINEDTNRNATLESGEDVNGSDKLEPRKSDVTIRLMQTKTRADGSAELEMEYSKNFATWVDARITVTASGVLGTEGRDSVSVVPLPFSAPDITNDAEAPAFRLSPYGRNSSCTSPL